MLAAAAASVDWAGTTMKAIANAPSTAKPLAAADRLFQSSNVISYFDAVLFAIRSGKLREMLYSVILEACYWWCYVFRTNSRLIQFNPTPFWRCCSECHVDFVGLAATLRLCNFYVLESPTKWVVLTESADGTAPVFRTHTVWRASTLAGFSRARSPPSCRCNRSRKSS